MSSPPAAVNGIVENGSSENSKSAENGSSETLKTPGRRPCLWYEEEIDETLRWCFGLKRILRTGSSKYQDIALLDTDPFGKVLIIDNKLQSAEVDEWVYHESLVHPALLYHSGPSKVFIMGGGEGATAREVLRHKSVRNVVMCDIDEDVVSFCSRYLSANRDAFRSSRLELVIKDARLELQTRNEQFDVVIGDLADPMEGGPCYRLYTKDFYENILKPRLSPGGILVTQAGPAGILSHADVFSSIYNTLRNVFTYVVAYAAHVPSYADTWGWVMASDKPFPQISTEDLDARIKQRLKGELRYLDGATLAASTILNKTVRRCLASETHVYTEDSARFVYGHGRAVSLQ